MNNTLKDNAPIPVQTEFDSHNADDEKLRNQFHPAFCASMELELREDREHLIFEKEYNLNTKPNSIDFLVINKVEDIKVKSGLGAIFKKHNIFEFKSFNDSLNKRVYYRTLGYVYLYIAYGNEIISPEEVTVSFLREGYPRKLMTYFKNNGFYVTDYENGIYHIKKENHVDMQVIVTGRLGSSYAWINKITNKLKPQDIFQMEDEYASLDNEIDLVNAESVMDMSISLNKDKEFIKEMIGMGILKDMMEKERAMMKQEKDMMEKEKDMMKKEVEEKNNTINELNEQIQNKDDELRTEKEENLKLRKELDEIKKLLGNNKIAML